MAWLWVAVAVGEQYLVQESISNLEPIELAGRWDISGEELMSQGPEYLGAEGHFLGWAWAQIKVTQVPEKPWLGFTLAVGSGLVTR